MSHYWRTMQRKTLRRAEVPGPQKVVFRSRTDDGRNCAVVDFESIISFAPPSILVLEHRHRDADKLSVTFRLKPDVVIFAIQVAPEIYPGIAIVIPVGDPAMIRLRLPVLRVEVQRSRWQRLCLLSIVDVPVEIAQRLLAFVCHSDPGMFCVWHLKIAIERTIISDR